MLFDIFRITENSQTICKIRALYSAEVVRTAEFLAGAACWIERMYSAPARGARFIQHPANLLTECPVDDC